MSAAPADGHAALPKSDLTLHRARQKLAGWHFAQECLSLSEREILHVAEALLREVDRLVEVFQVGEGCLCGGDCPVPHVCMPGVGEDDYPTPDPPTEVARLREQEGTA